MADVTSKNASKPAEQTIEALQQRYQKLNRTKIESETKRDEARKRLDELKAQARTKFGTDDVAELQKKLNDIIEENARKKASYQADLDKIEKDLADVETKFAEAGNAPANPNPTRR